MRLAHAAAAAVAAAFPSRDAVTVQLRSACVFCGYSVVGTVDAATATTAAATVHPSDSSDSLGLPCKYTHACRPSVPHRLQREKGKLVRSMLQAVTCSLFTGWRLIVLELF